MRRLGGVACRFVVTTCVSEYLSRRSSALLVRLPSFPFPLEPLRVLLASSSYQIARPANCPTCKSFPILCTSPRCDSPMSPRGELGVRTLSRTLSSPRRRSPPFFLSAPLPIFPRRFAEAIDHCTAPQDGHRGTRSHPRLPSVRRCRPELGLPHLERSRSCGPKYSSPTSALTSHASYAGPGASPAKAGSSRFTRPSRTSPSRCQRAHVLPSSEGARPTRVGASTAARNGPRRAVRFERRCVSSELELGPRAVSKGYRSPSSA